MLKPLGYGDTSSYGFLHRNSEYARDVPAVSNLGLSTLWHATWRVCMKNCLVSQRWLNRGLVILTSQL